MIFKSRDPRSDTHRNRGWSFLHRPGELESDVSRLVTQSYIISPTTSFIELANYLFSFPFFIVQELNVLQLNYLLALNDLARCFSCKLSLSVS